MIINVKKIDLTFMWTLKSSIKEFLLKKFFCFHVLKFQVYKKKRITIFTSPPCTRKTKALNNKPQ